MILVPNSAPDRVFSFVRQNEKDKVFAVINFSNEPQAVTFKENLYHGKYTEYFSGEQTEMNAAAKLKLEPWTYKIFVK